MARWGGYARDFFQHTEDVRHWQISSAGNVAFTALALLYGSEHDLCDIASINDAQPAIHNPWYLACKKVLHQASCAGRPDVSWPKHGAGQDEHDRQGMACEEGINGFYSK